MSLNEMLLNSTCSKKSSNIFRVGIFLDFVWPTTRTPHGAYARRARRNRIDPHGVDLNASGTAVYVPRPAAREEEDAVVCLRGLGPGRGRHRTHNHVVRVRLAAGAGPPPPTWKGLGAGIARRRRPRWFRACARRCCPRDVCVSARCCVHREQSPLGVCACKRPQLGAEWHTSDVQRSCRGSGASPAAAMRVLRVAAVFLSCNTFGFFGGGLWGTSDSIASQDWSSRDGESTKGAVQMGVCGRGRRSCSLRPEQSGI